MSKQKVTKPLIENGQAEKQLTPEQAAKKLELARKRKSAAANLKKKTITAGALSFIPILFYYADGRTQWITIPKDNAKKFGITSAPEGTLSETGKGVTKVKTKLLKVSYGFKIIKRKKAASGRVKSRGGSLVDTQVRAFISVSVPDDATLIDVVAFARTFPKTPGLLRFGQQDFIMDYKRAVGGAGAAK